MINNSRIGAAPANETLVVETIANDNDWDGAARAGILRAEGGTLELRDNTLRFTGSVPPRRRTVFTNGFALDFNPGSNRTHRSNYQSTHSTDIGGTVTVNVGADSTLDIQVNRFLTFESTSVTTLNGNLRLVTNNASISAGAMFSGPARSSSQTTATHGRSQRQSTSCSTIRVPFAQRI